MPAREKRQSRRKRKGYHLIKRHTHRPRLMRDLRRRYALLETCECARGVGRKARLESARIARSIDKFEMREQRNGYERERYLGARLRSEPDRCEEERPEDRKGAL
jgi:hypothetical protein